MNSQKYKQKIIDRIRQLITKVRDILPYAHNAFQKPATIIYILITAHRAQITLGVLLILLVFAAPAVVDFITGFLFPPETSKKIFGLIKTQQENNFKEYSYTILMTLLWMTSIIYSVLRFLFDIPNGLEQANAVAQRLLNEGDNHSDEIYKNKLYKRALAIVADSNLEFELKTRIKERVVSSKSNSDLGSVYENKDLIDHGTLIDKAQTTSREASSSQACLVERYILGPELGRGAMGVVYRGWDQVLDRKVAIKQLSLLLSSDDEFVSRFRREAKALARLTHTNVVQVYDLIEDDNLLWMVLEFVNGGDLASLVKEKGRLSIDEVINIIIPVVEGLTCAHDQGIIHRDLKPANILLSRTSKPKISDFGIAKMSQSSQLTQVGSVLGSPPYMSPEQCSGSSVDKRTDIYSLGITLYELLSGKVPFEGGTSSVLARQIVEQPKPLSEIIDSIHPEMEDFVLRMLAKNPDNRPADMEEVKDSLLMCRERNSSSKRSHVHH